VGRSTSQRRPASAGSALDRRAVAHIDGFGQVCQHGSMQRVPRVLRFAFAVRLDPDEDDTLHGWVPALPGVHTFGDTEEETLAGLREAVQLHVESLLRDGLPVPDDAQVAGAEALVEAVVPWAMLSPG